MCRWAAWSGAPIFMRDVVTAPEHALVVQSKAATQSKTVVNGDGFGLAWYNHWPEPALYRDVHPAWSDPNLPSLTAQIKSPLFMAHVRASTGTAISRNNCHPFAVGRWSFMHNGQVGGYDRFRKQADMAIEDALYMHRKGASDSEVLFLLALGHGLDTQPLQAIAAALAQLETMSRRLGAMPYMRCAAAFSDGQRLICIRHASDRFQPTLYYRHNPERGGVMVVSEPIDLVVHEWTAVPPSSFLVIEEGRVSLHRLEDVRETGAQVAM